MMHDRVRQRLLYRIHRRYQTHTHGIKLGPVEFNFTRIADPDRVLDQVAAEEDRRELARGRRATDDELHLPYWAELWDSATAIGQFIVNLHHPLAAPQANTQPLGTVLDMGCGMGFAGTVAAALGARVLFADLETPALLFATLNSLPWRHRARARRLDWRRDQLGQQFDLILGADILYDRSQWPYLEPFWRNHLAPAGHILLGEPGRQTGDLFIPWITEQRWRLEQFEQPVPTRPRPVRILRLSPPQP
ncbi:MAG: hypothetical protein NTU53_10165 [Planctomycetota bacterium]|nr:hypothetical protein [Planctomycetota bacterium]